MQPARGTRIPWRPALRALALLSCTVSCVAWENRSISKEPAVIAHGEATFAQSCSGCHNFSQNGIGPRLSGLTEQVSARWIERFVRDPAAVASSGDTRARELMSRYTVPMPSYTYLSADEMTGLLAYLHSEKAAAPGGTPPTAPVADPVPDSIAPSTLTVALQLVTQVPSSSPNGELPRTRITKLDYEPRSGRSFVLDLRTLRTPRSHTVRVHGHGEAARQKFIHEPGLATGFG
ncbi:MAG: cytochrome c [Gemmatimonadaceae bacterium]